MMSIFGIQKLLNKALICKQAREQRGTNLEAVRVDSLASGGPHSSFETQL